MFRKILRTESGYSLVEVMVSIIILAIAILPMAGMFDMGLNSATKSSYYDRARTLANLEMEKAKAMSFNDVRDGFPVSGSTPVAGSYDSGYISVTGPGSADFPNPPFQYRVQKQYMTQPAQNPGSSSINFGPPSGSVTGLIRITVTVSWGSNTYTTVGLVS